MITMVLRSLLLPQARESLLHHSPALHRLSARQTHYARPFTTAIMSLGLSKRLSKENHEALSKYSACDV